MPVSNHNAPWRSFGFAAIRVFDGLTGVFDKVGDGLRDKSAVKGKHRNYRIGQD